MWARYQQGDAILVKGHKLLPTGYRSAGLSRAKKSKVYRPLSVSILNTGDELITPGQRLNPGQDL